MPKEIAFASESLDCRPMKLQESTRDRCVYKWFHCSKSEIQICHVIASEDEVMTTGFLSGTLLLWRGLDLSIIAFSNRLFH